MADFRSIASGWKLTPPRAVPGSAAAWTELLGYDIRRWAIYFWQDAIDSYFAPWQVLQGALPVGFRLGGVNEHLTINYRDHAGLVQQPWYGWTNFAGITFQVAELLWEG